MRDHETLDVTAVTGLSVLEDSARRGLYEYITAQREPVSRDQAAAASGMSRTLAAYHLDKLVEADLLHARFERPEGRGGPGAGRPAKLYSPVRDAMSVTVPPRDYQLLAELFVEAVEHDASGAVSQAIAEVARRSGRKQGEKHMGALIRALRASGYWPIVDDDHIIRLRNCPFHALIDQHRETVCQLNLERVSGVVEGSGLDEYEAVLNPAPEHCCVQVNGPRPCAFE